MEFTWEELFEGDGLPDKRLGMRACLIGHASEERPGAAMTGAFNLWKDTRNAYNFFANKRVTFTVVLESPMTVVGRALREGFEGTTVLNVQDTTEINLSHLNSMTGLGEIGNPKNRGLFLHPKRAHDARYRILIRAAQDRRVEGEHSTLWAQAASLRA